MSRVFGGCRALMAAVKAAGTKTAKTPPASKSSAAAAKATATATETATEARPKNISGIQKPVRVSPAMKEFLGGVPEISRPAVVKKIWEHIKLNDLQNPANRREIFCDDKLRVLFEGRDKVEMLEIAKLLSPHFVKSG